MQHYYADDSQIYLTFKNEESEQAIAALNNDLHNLFQLSDKHCLQLNPTKSGVMVFGRRADRESFISAHKDAIKIQDVIIPIFDIYKNLGLYMDTDLRFSHHINKCLQKAYASLKLIYNSRHFLDKKSKTILCDSLVLSHFNHADIVYGPCLRAFDSNRIQIL